MRGKRVRGATYLHRSAVHLMTPQQSERLEAAQLIAPEAIWNVVRIEPGVVGLLDYEHFDQMPFPALLSACRVDLIKGTATTRRYCGAENPLILHRKELTLDPSDSRFEEWSALTTELVERGLFHDGHLIGRQKQWTRRLAEAGIHIVNHRACPI